MTSKPEPKDVKPPVHKRVKTATAGAGAGGIVGGFILWLLSDYVFNGEVPLPVIELVMLFVPGIVAFVGGYLPKVR